MMTMSNNIRLKELDLTSNNLFLRKDTKPGDKVRIKDNLSTFMLSNKTMNHLIISDCNIDRKTAELIVSIFMLRPSLILVHTDNNPQIFDSVSLIDTNWYMKVYSNSGKKLTGCLFCDKTVIREVKLTSSNFPKFHEYKTTVIYMHSEYYEFNPILMHKNEYSI